MLVDAFAFNMEHLISFLIFPNSAGAQLRVGRCGSLSPSMKFPKINL